MATLSLFDWCVVALAGTGQPVSRIIRDLVLDEGGRPTASVIGAARKVPPRAAAVLDKELLKTYYNDEIERVFKPAGCPP